MNEAPFFDRLLPHIKKWFFSFLLILPSWIIIEQFWLALARNILLAVNYSYPSLIWPLLFTMDNLTLIIHEGGHSIFGIFGWRFLAILGGTLMQMLIPFLIFITAWHKKQRYIAQFSLFWLGFTWLDSAAYCADAYWRNLPLIGNLPKSAHDFYNILSKVGLLDEYRIVAWIMYSVGISILLLSFFWPLFERKERILIDLSKELKKSGLR